MGEGTDETPSPQRSDPVPITSPPPISERPRCDWCGQDLTGLSETGQCPGCEREYDEVSSRRLLPWPSPFSLCILLGWPIIGVALCTAGAPLGDASILLGYGLLLVLPVNSYITVRRLLKRHLPEGKRIHGFIAVLRAIGTTLCVLVFLALLVPAIILGACLMGMHGRY